MFLEINQLEKVYHTRFSKEQTRALQDVDFKVEDGEFIAIMGESGSGKTTLLNILATLEKPTKGSVILGGQDITKIKENKPTLINCGSKLIKYFLDLILISISTVTMSVQSLF